MKVIYCRSHAPGSVLIRTFDGLRWWGHCAGLIDAETVIEARAFSGVQPAPLADVIRRSTEWVIVDRPLPDEVAGAAWALSTIGARYDWLGAVGVPANRDWEHPDRWFCSEHVTRWEMAGGLYRFRPDVRGISPNDSYMVSDEPRLVLAS